jgi:hypothetical protein
MDAMTAQTALDAVPDPPGSGLVALETLYGRDARQAVPNRDQPFRWPCLGQKGVMVAAAAS